MDGSLTTPILRAPAVLINSQRLGSPSKDFYGIIWEIVPNVGPHPLFGNPSFKKKFKIFFFVILGTESILYLAPPVCPIPFNLAYSTTVLHLPKMVFALKSNLKSTIYSSVVIVTPWHPLLHALCLDLWGKASVRAIWLQCTLHARTWANFLKNMNHPWRQSLDF